MSLRYLKDKAKRSIDFEKKSEDEDEKENLIIDLGEEKEETPKRKITEIRNRRLFSTPKKEKGRFIIIISHYYYYLSLLLSLIIIISHYYYLSLLLSLIIIHIK
ncbi:hypothetical protein HC928_10955 [bacterium]|nr:hypothetical protein [bacterium]